MRIVQVYISHVRFVLHSVAGIGTELRGYAQAQLNQEIISSIPTISMTGSQVITTKWRLNFLILKALTVGGGLAVQNARC
jgi:hypothetical protein